MTPWPGGGPARRLVRPQSSRVIARLPYTYLHENTRGTVIDQLHNCLASTGAATYTPAMSGCEKTCLEWRPESPDYYEVCAALSFLLYGSSKNRPMLHSTYRDQVGSGQQGSVPYLHYVSSSLRVVRPRATAKTAQQMHNQPKLPGLYYSPPASNLVSQQGCVCPFNTASAGALFLLASISGRPPCGRPRCDLHEYII